MVEVQGPPAETRRGRFRRDPHAPRLPREIWALAAAGFIIAVGYGLIAPVLPTFARSFDVGVTAASIVVSAFAVFRLLFAPTSGRLVNRFGELPTFVTGLTVVALSTAACAFAADYWQLLLFRALGGIGSTMFTVSSVSLLVRLAPPQLRGRASGLWATGFLLGNIAGPLVGGFLVVISLRAPFLVYAAILVVALVVGLVMLRDRNATESETTGESPPEMAFGTALRHRAFRAALLANFGVGWVVFGVRVALVPLFIIEVLRRDESWSGVALAVFAAGNALMTMWAGRISDRYGRRPPILIGLAVAAASTAVFGVIPSLPVFLVVSAVAGLGSGLMYPPTNAAVADVVGNRARGGSVLAGFQMASDIGAILGPVIGGLIAETAGYAVAFGATGAVLALGFAYWLRAPETRPDVSHGALATDSAEGAQNTDAPINDPTR